MLEMFDSFCMTILPGSVWSLWSRPPDSLMEACSQNAFECCLKFSGVSGPSGRQTGDRLYQLYALC